MATLAQNESKKTSKRVKAGLRIAFQNGIFMGSGNILGYDKIKILWQLIKNKQIQLDIYI